MKKNTVTVSGGDIKRWVWGFDIVVVDPDLIFSPGSEWIYRFKSIWGTVITKRKNKIRHAEKSPAITVRRVNGKIAREEWYRNGKRHRDNGPAVIEYVSGKRQKAAAWYLKGKITKLVLYHTNSQVYKEYYIVNNRLHRQNAPAIIRYDKKGNITSEEWYLNSRLHNPNGHARATYGYYLKGEKCHLKS